MPDRSQRHLREKYGVDSSGSRHFPGSAGGAPGTIVGSTHTAAATFGGGVLGWGFFLPLAGSAYTSPASFGGGAVYNVGPQTITGAAHTASATFGSGALGGLNTILGETHTAAASFGSGTVALASSDITGSAHTAAASFGSGTVALASSDITGSAHTAAGSFGSGALSQPVQTLVGSAHTAAGSFGSGALSQPAQTLTGSAHTAAASFGSGTMSQPAQTITGSAHTAAGSFGSGTMSQPVQTLTGSAHTAAGSFGSGTIASAFPASFAISSLPYDIDASSFGTISKVFVNGQEGIASESSGTITLSAPLPSAVLVIGIEGSNGRGSTVATWTGSYIIHPNSLFNHKDGTNFHPWIDATIGSPAAGAVTVVDGLVQLSRDSGSAFTRIGSADLSTLTDGTTLLVDFVTGAGTGINVPLEGDTTDGDNVGGSSTKTNTYLTDGPDNVLYGYPWDDNDATLDKALLYTANVKALEAPATPATYTTPFTLSTDYTWDSDPGTLDWTIRHTGGVFMFSQQPWAISSGMTMDTVLKTSVGGFTFQTTATGGTGTYPQGSPMIVLGQHYSDASTTNPFLHDTDQRGLAVADIDTLTVSARISIGGGEFFAAFQSYLFRGDGEGSCTQTTNFNQDGTSGGSPRSEIMYDMQVRHWDSRDPEADHSAKDRIEIDGVLWYVEMSDDSETLRRRCDFFMASELTEPTDINIAAMFRFVRDYWNAVDGSDVDFFAMQIAHWIEPYEGSVDVTVERFIVNMNATEYTLEGEETELAVIDVSDRVALWDFANSTLFQSSGGTGAVSDSDPVGYVEDLFGLDNGLQSTSGKRPLKGSGSGVHYVTGTTAATKSLGATVGLGADCTLVVAVRIADVTSGGDTGRAVLSYNGDSSYGWQLDAQGTGSWRFRCYANTGLGFTSFQPSPIVDYEDIGWIVLSIIFNSSAGTATTYLNGSQVAQTTAYNGSMDSSGLLRILAAENEDAINADCAYMCAWNDSDTATHAAIVAIAMDRVGI